MTESKFTTTFRTENQAQPQLTVRADVAEEFIEALQQVPGLAAEIAKAYEGFTGVLQVAKPVNEGGLGARRTEGPTSTPQGGQSASQAGAGQGQGAGNAALLLNGERQVIKDRFGKIEEYNHPQAPVGVRGPMVLVTRKTNDGSKYYTMWTDPAASSKWYPRPKVAPDQRDERVFPDKSVEFDHTPWMD